MAAEYRFDVTLPGDIVDAVELMVRSGTYGSVNEAVQDGLRALLERREDLEQWLQEEVVQGHAEYLADPSRAVPAGELMSRIRARQARRDQS